MWTFVTISFRVLEDILRFCVLYLCLSFLIPPYRTFIEYDRDSRYVLLCIPDAIYSLIQRISGYRQEGDEDAKLFCVIEE